MNDSSRRFIELLVAVAPPLKVTFEDTIAYWRPEPPPVTIAFGELGESLVEHYQFFGPDQIREIMTIIEEGINSQNDELSTAVATGLIEAIVGHASAVKDRLEPILSQFGPASRSHADAWANG